MDMLPDSAVTSPGFSGLSPSGRAYATDRLQGRLTFARAVLRYQPQIDLQNGWIAGAETLLCVPGARGPESAASLCAEIDAAGLTIALFEHQVRTACRVQTQWLRLFPHKFPLAVQVPTAVFESAMLLPIVLQSLDESGLDAGLLELEVEESAAIAGPGALRTLSRLRAAGLPIALSGINAARLNLRLLATLPVTKLRLDALPLLRAGDCLPERRVFDGLVGAARGLGLLVCATGVNSPQLLASVVRRARSLAQGDAVGAPLEPGDFLERLRDLNETTATLPILSG